MAPKKQSPVRWIDLNEGEKKEVLRIRNMEQCRKNRKRWKETDDEIRTLYDSNEKKIEKLEGMVTKLSSELGKSSSSSSSSKKTGRWSFPVCIYTINFVVLFNFWWKHQSTRTINLQFVSCIAFHYNCLSRSLLKNYNRFHLSSK